MKKYLYIFLLLFVSFCIRAQTTTLAVTGQDFNVTSLSSASLITKAGKNYETTALESSATNQTYIKVSALLGWTISVRQTTTANWDPALKISVRRTGDGTGTAIIGGGTAYQLVTSSTATSFFSGLLNLTSNRDAIPIQYKIEGFSVLLPVKQYSTTIQYTVSGL